MLYLGENSYDVYLGDEYARIYCGEELVYPTTITGISITKKYVAMKYGGTKELTIRSESAWTLSKDASATWVTLSADSGDSGVSKVTVTVAPNTGNVDLTTVLTAQTTDLQYSAVCQVSSFVGIENNTIEYTTSGGTVSNLPTTGYYGANNASLSIVSNVYADGKGVLTLSGDLVRMNHSRWGGDDITSVILPSTLEWVNNYEFALHNATSVTFESSVLTWFGHEAMNENIAKNIRFKKVIDMGFWSIWNKRDSIIIDDASAFRHINGSVSGATATMNTEMYAFWRGLGCDNADFKTDGVTLNSTLRAPGFGQSLQENFVPMGTMSLTHQGWVDFFGDLADITSRATPITIEMFIKDYEKLSAAELAIATNKGWLITTISSTTYRDAF